MSEITEAEAQAMGFPLHVAEHTYRKVYRNPVEREMMRVLSLRDHWQRQRGCDWERDWAWRLKVRREAK